MAHSNFSPATAHIFDETRMNLKSKTYQVCDMLDADVAGLFDTAPLHAQCHVQYGFYSNARLSKIRLLVRSKLAAFSEGETLSRDAVREIVERDEKQEDELGSTRDADDEDEEQEDDDNKADELTTIQDLDQYTAEQVRRLVGDYVDDPNDEYMGIFGD